MLRGFRDFIMRGNVVDLAVAVVIGAAFGAVVTAFAGDFIGGIKLDRFLFSSVVYPTDYGFVTDTLGEDGDPLDAMVLVSEPTFPGCLIEVDAVAVFRMSDDKGQDDKILCIPHSDPNWAFVRALSDLPDQLRTEIEHFFSIYKQPEGKEVEVDGWYERDEALRIVRESRQRWQESRS